MKQDGIVLITVLWIIAVISFISFALAAAVRTEVAAEGNSFDSERALFMAKSAGEIVFERLQNPDTFPDAPIRKAGGTYVFQFNSGESRVRLEGDGGRIDLNTANDKVLASMFESLGLGQGLRDQLVDCILDWRDSDDVPRVYGAEIGDYGQLSAGKGRRLPANESFKSIEELLLVKHMTGEIYFGHIEHDPATGGYRKVPGLRDIATVATGLSAVDVNAAPVDVLAALPGLNRDLARSIVTERKLKDFADSKDLVNRIPQLANSDTLQYLTTAAAAPTVVVSTATVRLSGTSRTARLYFKRNHEKKINPFMPYLFYKDVEVLSPDRWEY